MLKDYAWNAELNWLWLLATPPTVLIGIDFVVTTAVAGTEFLIRTRSVALRQNCSLKLTLFGLCFQKI